MSDTIRHFGFLSYCKRDNLQPYMTTTEDNQLITFNFDNRERRSNYLTIQAIDTMLYISINDDDDILVIDSGHIFEVSYQSLESIRILNPTGTKLRWYVQTY
jgi:hypothetical protein